MRSGLRVAVIASLLFLTVGLGLAFALGGVSLYIPPADVRSLAQIYLRTTYNTSFALSPLSPEAVTAIVWDYRGLDTLFETSVMFLAIVGALMLFRGLSEKIRSGLPGSQDRLGLTVIVKSVTKPAIAMILAVGASLALHGHITPGGGFQGGATIAVAPMLIIVSFSVYFLAQRISIKRAVLLRSLGLAVIALTTYIVLIIALICAGYAYIFQNQPKHGAPYGLPSYIGDANLLGGTLLLFNLAETLAVAFGFIALFILITAPEDIAKDVVLKGEE